MRKAFLILTLCAAGFVGCTAVTDFSDIEGGYSIREELLTPITVSLSSNNTGTIALGFDKALPKGNDADLLALLSNEVVTLEVEHVTTGTSYLLTQGRRVDDTPDSNGEYKLDLSENRKALTVTFYNSFNGSSVRVGESYAALIEVKSNEFFLVDVLTVTDVNVVGQ